MSAVPCAFCGMDPRHLLRPHICGSLFWLGGKPIDWHRIRDVGDWLRSRTVLVLSPPQQEPDR